MRFLKRYFGAILVIGAAIAAIILFKRKGSDNLGVVKVPAPTNSPSLDPNLNIMLPSHDPNNPVYVPPADDYSIPPSDGIDTRSMDWARLMSNHNYAGGNGTLNGASSGYTGTW